MRFVLEVWFGVLFIGSCFVLSVIFFFGLLREEYFEEFESIVVGMFIECLEDIIDEDGDDLGVFFEIVLELMVYKCK